MAETRMKTSIFSLFFLCFFTSAFACEQGEISFPENKVCATVSWISGPVLNQFSSANIHISETHLKLNVIPWMVMNNGHQHGSRPVSTTVISPNEYLVEKIYFMGGMMGDWFLKMQLVDDQNNIIEEVRKKIEL